LVPLREALVNVRVDCSHPSLSAALPNMRRPLVEEDAELYYKQTQEIRLLSALKR
jgi:hypothetical protein